MAAMAAQKLDDLKLEREKLQQEQEKVEAEIQQLQLSLKAEDTQVYFVVCACMHESWREYACPLAQRPCLCLRACERVREYKTHLTPRRRQMLRRQRTELKQRSEFGKCCVGILVVTMSFTALLPGKSHERRLVQSCY